MLRITNRHENKIKIFHDELKTQENAERILNFRFILPSMWWFFSLFNIAVGCVSKSYGVEKVKQTSALYANGESFTVPLPSTVLHTLSHCKALTRTGEIVRVYFCG